MENNGSRMRFSRGLSPHSRRSMSRLGEGKYADYVFFLSDQLLTQQNLDGADEAYGSFHGVPSANTGSYMEGLVDAIHAAQLVGDKERLQLYQERAKMGYRWLFTLQYGESDAAALKRPDIAQGGFRKTLPILNYGLITHSMPLAVSQKDYASFITYRLPCKVPIIFSRMLMNKNSTNPTTRTKKISRYTALMAGVVMSFTLLLFSCDFKHSEPLSRAILDRSLELGTQFLLNHQKPEGNFTYIYDWVKQTYDPAIIRCDKLEQCGD